MKRLVLIEIVVMALALPTSLILAQTPDNGSGTVARPTGSNISLVPELSRQASLPINESQAPPVVESRDQRPIVSPATGHRSESKSSTTAATRIQSLSEQFKNDRELVLKKRDAERKQYAEKLLNATGQERERLIAEFREKQRAWLAEQKALSEQEFRQRINSLREEFKNHERDVLLDEVKGKTREVRERLGKD